MSSRNRIPSYHLPDGRPVYATYDKTARLPVWRNVACRFQEIRHQYEAKALADCCVCEVHTANEWHESWRAGPNAVMYCDDWPHQVRCIVSIMKAHGWPTAGDALPDGRTLMAAGWYARRHHERTRAMARLILGIPANALIIHQPADEEEAP